MYEVEFSNRKVAIVSNEDGKWLEQIKLSLSPPMDVKVNDAVVALRTIVRVEPSREAFHQVDAFRPELLLPEGNACRGEHSLTLELTRYALKNRKYTEMKDPEWRKKVKDFIRSKYPNKQWCDSSTGECHCASAN